MNLDLFILGGYGQFVWPAFIFTFVSCFVLYLKTNRKLKKQEKMFSVEFEQIHTIKIESDKENKKEALSNGAIF